MPIKNIREDASQKYKRVLLVITFFVHLGGPSKDLDGHRDCWALDHLRIHLAELQLSKVLIIQYATYHRWYILDHLSQNRCQYGTKKTVMEGVL